VRIVQQIEFDLQESIRFAQAFTKATGIGCTVLDRMGTVRYPPMTDYPCRLCRTVTRTPMSREESSHGHWRWVEQAARFGGRYVFMCENAFTHWTSPILTEGRVTGGLVAGPVLTIEDEGFFENDLMSPDIDESHRDALRELFDSLPRIPPARVTALSELLYSISRTISDASARKLDETALELNHQSRINEYVQDLKQRSRESGRDPDTPTYPVETERALLDQIRRGDISRAQETLNALLGHVFFASGSDIDSIRHRTRELVILLSRAVLTEGADPEEVFGLNYRFVDALDEQNDINGVAFWMARIARRFADLVLYLPNLTHGTVMRKAVRYVQTNLSQKIRLTDVASHVGLSPTYFSRLFAEEMEVPFATYVIRRRLSRARELLRTTNTRVTDIATEVGISDPSYFTKLFRKETGLTPSEYRTSGA